MRGNCFFILVCFGWPYLSITVSVLIWITEWGGEGDRGWSKLTILLDQNEQAAFLHLFFYNHHMCLSPSYDFLFYTQIVCFLYIKWGDQSRRWDCGEECMFPDPLTTRSLPFTTASQTLSSGPGYRIGRWQALLYTATPRALASLTQCSNQSS